MGGYETGDTIVAPATALLPSALGVVRLSGPDAWDLARGLLAAPPRSIRAQHSFTAELIIDLDPGDPATAQLRETAVLTCWRGPHSYTGEDLVDVSLHGSPLLVRQLLALCTARGARPAEAGEFTYRAYLNGKLDLAQAEAVQELIAAGSGRALLLAGASLAGVPSALVREWVEWLTATLAGIEVTHDYAADGLDATLDAEELAAPHRLAAELGELLRQVDQALQDSRRTAPLREGITVALVGPPNVGKSTLFNALLGHERALTDPAPGTTRDYITETIDSGGIRLTLVDTAGYRDVADAVEAAGVRRAGDWARAADRVLWVTAADGERVPLPGALESDEPISVVTRCDRLEQWPDVEAPGSAPGGPVCYVSGKTGRGVAELWAVLWGAAGQVQMPVLAAFGQRQAGCIAEAAGHLRRALTALEGRLPTDAVAQDLYAARRALQGVYQHPGRQEVIDQIFSRFCVGK